MNTPSIFRSIHFFYIDGVYGGSSLSFDTLKNIFQFIESIRTTSIKDLYYTVPDKEGTDMFLALSIIKDNNIFGKTGYARRTNFPETLDSQGHTDVLSLPKNRFLYEPSHFVIYRSYNNIPVLVYEFNVFGPRPQRVFSYYIRSFAVKYCEEEGKPDCESVRIVLNRLYKPNVVDILKNFDIIRGIEIRVKVSEIRRRIDVIKKSNSLIDLIVNDVNKLLSGSKTYELRISTGRRKEEGLDITISDIVDALNELYPALEKFLVKAKSTDGKTVPIDLINNVITTRKKIKQSMKGNVVSRSADTEDAFKVLRESYEELKDTIHTALMKILS